MFFNYLLVCINLKNEKINFADPYIGSYEKKLLLDAYNSKWISLGKYNRKLEIES